MRIAACLVVLCLLCCSREALQAQSASAPHDLRYIAEKPLVAIWSRPQEHLANPAIAGLYQQLDKLGPDKTISQALGKIDLVRVSYSASKEGNSSTKDTPAAVLHFTDPAAAAAMFKVISQGMIEKRIAGMASPVMVRTYQMPPGQPEPDWKELPCCAQLNPQTIVQAQSGEALSRVLSPPASAAPPAWSTELTTLAKTPTVVLIDLVQVREMVNAALAGAPPMQGLPGMLFSNVKTVWESADYAFLGLDTTQGLVLTAQATSPSPESAQRVKATLETLLVIAKGFLPQAKMATAQLNAQQPGLGDQAYGELEAVVNSITVTQAGTQTKLALSVKQESLARVPMLVLPMIVSARARAQQMVALNNVKQIGLAMHAYGAAFRGLPPAVKLGPDGKTPHSWRVAILPFLEESTLYHQYKFDEPWDSENNKKLLDKMPAVYRSSSAPNTSNTTNMVVITHENGVFTATPVASGTKFPQITDGMSRTLLVVEANTQIPWTKPEDLPLVDGQPLPALGMPGKDAIMAGLCDGSAMMLTTKVGDSFRALVTRNDGTAVDFSSLMAPAGGPPGPMMPGASVKPMTP